MTQFLSVGCRVLLAMPVLHQLVAKVGSILLSGRAGKGQSQRVADVCLTHSRRPIPCPGRMPQNRVEYDVTVSVVVSLQTPTFLSQPVLVLAHALTTQSPRGDELSEFQLRLDTAFLSLFCKAQSQRAEQSDATTGTEWLTTRQLPIGKDGISVHNSCRYAVG
jgi:hypothetical protein